MATKIVTKNSSTASAVPTASDLVQGELAVNVADKRLFTEDNGGSIVELGTNPSTIDINAGTIDGAVIGGTTPAAITGSTVTSTGNIVVTGTVDGRDVAADGTKLDGVEASADVTDTTNVTAAGALMDSEVTNLAQVKAFDSADYATAAQGTTADAALPKAGGALTGAVTTNSTFDGRDVATDGTKLDGIEVGATADQTAAEIKTAYESNADTNAFTDADHTKLAGIEASADVTDTANVTAAGAVMDSELTSEASVKALNQGVATTDSPAFAGLTVDTDTLAVDSTNNRVGIGTTSPNRSLEANSTQVVVASFKSTSTSNESRISFSDPNTTDDTKVTIGSIGDALKINTLGSERLRIDSSGNVGIGTSSPSKKLHISAASDSDLGTVALGIGGPNLANARGAHITKDTSSPWDFTIQCSGSATANTATIFKSSDAVETMRIDSSGKVGIGTTSPNSLVDIEGANSQLRLTDSDDNKFLEFSYSGGKLITRNNSASTTTNQFTLTEDGKLGIGTTSPTSKLHLYKTGTSDNKLTIQNGQNAYASILDLRANNDGGAIYNALTSTTNGGTQHWKIWGGAASNTMAFSTGGTERMRIDSSGNLLLGVTSTNVTSGGYVFRTGAVDYQMIGHASGVATGNYYIGFAYNGSTIGAIVQNGTTGIAYNTSSDYRLKTDAQPMTGATARLKALKPVNFEWIADGTRVDGFLAHEAQEVVPECVSGEKDAVDVDGNPEYQGIDQSKLVPLLVATIQELEARITQLENN